jgi:hypothetical protein
LRSGGYGSDGADGAAGGNIFLTVHDDDTDLLLPLKFDVQGGAGGQSGQHGEPGDGGIGGRGGKAFAWFVGTTNMPAMLLTDNSLTGQSAMAMQ